MADMVSVRISTSNKKRIAKFGDASDSIDVALGRALDLAETNRSLPQVIE